MKCSTTLSLPAALCCFVALTYSFCRGAEEHHNYFKNNIDKGVDGWMDGWILAVVMLSGMIEPPRRLAH